MPERYFFGRREISCNRRRISVNDGVKTSLAENQDSIVTAKLIKNPIEDVSKLFNVGPSETVSAILK